jgi:hypothetical protein
LNTRKCLILASLLLLVLPAPARDKETIAELITKADSAPADKRPELYIKIAERQLKAADHAFDANDVSTGKARATDAALYTERAADAAIASRKKLKKIEISARKMSDKLSDIKRTLNFEDQAPVQAAIDRMEAQRTRLLAAMFSKGKK